MLLELVKLFVGIVFLQKNDIIIKIEISQKTFTYDKIQQSFQL